jgi:putative nucleotidyltransferase with HDIG domain
MNATAVPLRQAVPVDVLEVWREALAACPDLLLTGGSVRDLLLGRQVRDLDFVAQDPTAAAEALRRQFSAPAVPLGGPHDLYRIPLQGRAVREIDLTGYADLELDATRRDLTINALYATAPAEPGLLEVIDFVGGLGDLGGRVLRAPSPEAFRSDPLRVMRLARLAVDYEFAVDPATEAAARSAAPELAGVSPERVRDELFRTCSIAASASALRRLDAIGAFDIILPEMVATKGCEQPKEHYWDVFGHSLACVETADWLLDAQPVAHLSAEWRERFWEATAWASLHESMQEEAAEGRTRSALLKFACLMHDLAKPQTKSVDPAGRTRFFGHASEGARIARTTGRRLRLSDREVRTLVMLVKEHLRPGQIARDGPPTNRALRRLFEDARDGLPELLLLTLCDGIATVGPRERAYDFDLHLRYISWLLYRKYGPEHQPPAPLLDGHDVMTTLALPSGRLVGAILSSVREAQLDGEIHSRDEALQLARSVLERLDPAEVARARSVQPD